MEKKIQTIASLHSPSFSAHLDEVRYRNGESGKRIWIEHPEAAAIIPFISEKEIIMVRQFRYALGSETLEIPAGKVDPEEKPEACAQRELFEETGYRAKKLDHIYAYAPAIGYSNELIHIYAARELIKETSDVDEKEISGIEIMNIAALQDMVKRADIRDGKTLLALSLLRLL